MARRMIVTFGEMIIAPLLAVYLILVSTLSVDVIPGLVIGGAVAWTLAEYGVHRLLHDFMPVHHRTHHAQPELAVETIFWPIWIGFVVTYLLAGGVVLAGVLLAYAWYLLVHHESHHGSIVGTPASLYRHHQGHHKFATRNYGVSTTLWDRVFGTML